MKRVLLTLIFTIACAFNALAQVQSQRVVFTSSNPPTSCVAGKVYTNPSLSPAKEWIGTSAGTCTLISTGGTVTSVTGTANQINVATGTTTPALTLSSTIVTPGTLTVTGLTSGRVPIIGASGLISDDSDLTFATDTLTATKLGATTLTGTISGGGQQLNNIIIGTTTPLAGSFTFGGFGIAGAAGTRVNIRDSTGSGTNYGVDSEMSGAAAVNVGGYFSATGATNNYGLQLSVAAAANNYSIKSDGTAQSLFAGPIINTGITTDATHTDSTVCQDTTTHQFYFGSGAAGICLGTSSARFKRDIKPLSLGLKQIVGLKPVSFNYLKGYGDEGARRQVGFIAEEVNKTMPSLVGLDKDGKPQSVDYMGVMVVATQAIKELSAKVDAQQQEIVKLRRMVRQMRKHR